MAAARPGRVSLPGPGFDVPRDPLGHLAPSQTWTGPFFCESIAARVNDFATVWSDAWRVETREFAVTNATARQIAQRTARTVVAAAIDIDYPLARAAFWFAMCGAYIMAA